MQTLLAIEKKVCATGTAWGLLSGAPLWQLIAFWLLRHGIYGTIAVVLIVRAPASALAVSIFFLVVHMYKGFRFMQMNGHSGEKAVPATPSSEVKNVMIETSGNGLDNVPV